ncbi:MAG: AAA family ATPase [Deltaproteobacteria bacterium]|jgi:hypothetical protein|nr:AAA family ATPase [Deltaproteobacteria bacterium]
MVNSANANGTSLRKLPAVGIDFATIRNDNFVYVDKTKIIYDLARAKGAYFLARPPRFGKSLLISTLKELFSGDRALFKGLWIDSSDYPFEKYPVISLMMDVDCFGKGFLKYSLRDMMSDEAQKYGLEFSEDISAGAILKKLVERLSKEKNEGVVVLIDEYDNPINNAIDDLSLAKHNLKELNNFYISLKTLMNTGKIYCLFVTGVTKIPSDSIFSAMDCLIDITMNHDYAEICGFTAGEFDKYFGAYQDNILSRFKSKKWRPYIKTVDDLREEIFKWYGGFSFDGEEKILSPHSINCFFYHKKFDNFWSATETPTFLSEYITRDAYNLATIETQKFARSDLLNFTLDNIKLAPLLFQAGYLTIKKRAADGKYFLGEPNNEVKDSFQNFLFEFFKSELNLSVTDLKRDINNALANYDSLALENAFKKIIASVPRQSSFSYGRNCQGLIFLALTITGFNAMAEVSETEGDLELLTIVKSPPTVFIVKFNYERMEKTPGEKREETTKKLLEKGIIAAKTQIEKKRYADKYINEYPTVKKVAASIVGKGDISVEIYDAF